MDFEWIEDKKLKEEVCVCVKDNEPDECLGMLPGVANACCGHNTSEAYVQFLDGSCIRGEDAKIIQNILKKDVEIDSCANFLNYQIKDFEISKFRNKKNQQENK